MGENHRHLFLDDHCIKEISSLNRTMHQPEKKGAVFKQLGEAIQIRGAPMWVPEEKIYKMVYLSEGRFYATSKDGVQWDIPDLGRPNSLAKNQTSVDSSDPRWRGGPENVIIDLDDPDQSRRYKALLGGGRDRLPGVSANAYDYKPLNIPTIPSSDESHLVYDREKGRYLAIVKIADEWGRAFSISFSTDFENWEPPVHSFGADEEDQIRTRDVIKDRLSNSNGGGPLFVDPEPPSGYMPEKRNFLSTWAADVYNFPVFPYEGMYIGLPTFFYSTGLSGSGDNTDGIKDIQLTCSRDLINWDRLGDRRPFISASRTKDGLLGIYDRNQISTASHPVERGDELWFYYTGTKFRTSPYGFALDRSTRHFSDLSPLERADLEEGLSAICLAVLRRDGFISLDANEIGGSLLTCPISVVGSSLYLNLAVPKGQAVVEVLDGDGNPVVGLSKADCFPIAGDSVGVRVQWLNGDLEALEGKEVQLRIYLTNGSLYSFWFE